MHRKLALATGLLFSANLFAAPSPEELKAMFIKEVSQDQGLTADAVKGILDQAEKNQQVLDAIARPWEAKPWYQYRPIFLTDERIEKGVAFWKENQELLAKAEQQTGVPAKIIVAILGVETYYGTRQGNYRVLDSLYSLGFYYPPRATFFRKQLAEFIRLTEQEKLDLTGLKGSYAGAMGYGQFIPSSYLHYAIDFDGDKVRDLFSSKADAIGSIGNYLQKNGWKTGEEIAFPATLTSVQAKQFVREKLEYQEDWQTLSEAGVSLSTNRNVAPSAKAKLLAFEQQSSEEYWLGLENFYVITRYNHSPLYAMAVFQLAQAITEKMGS